jgi:hypothetical protein
MIRPYVLLLALALLAAAANAGAAERGRVKVVQTARGPRLVTDQGTPLRGGAAWVYQWGRIDKLTTYATDPAYHQRMREHGLNAVRVICFDPWQKSNGYVHADLDKPQDVKALLAELDAVVDLAAGAGLYALIDYHDVGTYDLPYLTRFWELVAPRYKDRTHVLYELTNEPVQWHAEDYRPSHLADLAAVYERVRTAAPDTHVVVLSFANSSSSKADVSMRTVARAFDRAAGGVDWSKASVGFHPYNTRKTSGAIVDLAKEFPALNTEQNLPHFEHFVPMDGEEFGTQTMERLGLGWFHWQVEGPEKFEKNYVGRVRADAEAKGYAWKPDR